MPQVVEPDLGEAERFTSRSKITPGQSVRRDRTTIAATMARAKRYTWKQLKKVLEEHGWEVDKGGKHVTKMVKKGHRPITLPHHKGQTYDIGLSSSVLKAAGIEDD